MLEDFNLLVSSRRGMENAACSEFWYLLKETGDPEPLTDTTPVRGLIVAKTSLDPFEVVKKLRRFLEEKPEEFQYTLKVTPVQRVVKTRIEDIKEVAKQLAENIGVEEKFRVTVEKRHTELDRMEVIKAVAEEINRKVDLKNPDKILLIEIVGGLTGISVLRPSDILSVEKEKHI
ncbi:MAG: THUMP domain-containing protein [Candidatus Bathyarchaeota archaeon]|nr:THUMP domain-containing protein [Candidatus Bathyarchaeota archaeon]